MDRDTQKRISEEFSHIEGAYFNTAYSGPVPLGARAEAEKALAVEMNPVKYTDGNFPLKATLVRQKIAQLLAVDESTISHNTSVGEIVSQIALGFPFESGDVVIGLNGDYPSNVLPWKVNSVRRNFKHVLLDEENFLNLELLNQNLPEQTKLINISFVRFDTGKSFDLLALGQFCQERDILLVVDAAQGFGSVPVLSEELKLIDVFMCPTYKWLLGPYGHAFAYYSPRALDMTARTTGHFFASKDTSFNRLVDYSLEAKEGAYQFDRGQAPGFMSWSLLEYSLNMISEIGLEKIHNHNQSLVQQFLAGVPKNKYSHSRREGEKSSIVSLDINNEDAQLLEEKLAGKSIYCSLREGKLRFAFHFFNTSEQVEQLLSSLN